MDKIKLFNSLVEKAQKIVITTHIHPDADGIGSEIALCMALRTLGKEVYCVNEEPLLERYKYLDANNVLTSAADFKKDHPNFEIDLFIVADTNTLTRIGNKMQSFPRQAKNLLFIDHHPAPKEVAAIHCIDTTQAATGQLVGTLIESLNIEFTEEMALPLYTAILIDTSSFRYPTVSSETHRILSKLLETGIRPPEAYNYIYGTKKISYMQYLGVVLSSAQSTADGKVAWIHLTEDQMGEFQVDSEDTHGFINHLLILDNIKVACMFRKIDNQIKISFRSAGDIDVGLIAQALGGGGHDHSAATIIKNGDIEQVIAEVIPKITMMIS